MTSTTRSARLPALPRVLSIAAASLLVLSIGGCSGTGGSASGSPAAAGTAQTSKTCNGAPAPAVHAPTATPLAKPPAAPASDGTTATIKTKLGDIVIQLYTQSSPVAAANFIGLANACFYDGVVFHRIVPGFVIQGGDPEGNGSGGPGYTIRDEPVVGDYTRGVVAMARTPRPNSQGSQFFICLADLRGNLDKAGGYAIFGTVTKGMDLVDRIAAAPNDGSEGNGGAPIQPVAMTSVTISPP